MKIVASLVVGLALVACSQGPNPAYHAQSRTNTPAPVETSAAPCIGQDFVTHNTKASSFSQAAVHDIRSYDFSAAQQDLLLAASETRAAADALRPVDPQAADHYDRGADDIERSASLINKNLSEATNYVVAGTNEIKQANVGDQFCSGTSVA